MNNIASYIDHTMLAPQATVSQIRKLCEEAVKYHFASVCVNSCHVALCAELLKGTGVNVCTVVGFPLGAMSTKAKAFEAECAVADGAVEIDMVINVGALKDENWTFVEDDIRAVKKACGGKLLKVILETCLLTDEEKEKMCDIVVEAGADFIKTSTGFSTAGATFHDIELFNRCVAGRCKIKAAGGIKSVDDMEKFISLGADRLGTSSAIKLLKNQETGGAY